MPRLNHPPTLKSVHVHAPKGISYVVFALLAVLNAYVANWMWATIGEPYRAALEQNERIQATGALMEGIDLANARRLSRWNPHKTAVHADRTG